MNCQCFIIPIIMIFIILLFIGDNNIRKEGFIGCPVVPNTSKVNYLGPINNINIDEMCTTGDGNQKWVPWSCFWRKNYQKSIPDGVGGETLYNDMKTFGYHEPFKYDGVYEVRNETNKCV
jgi:hypothetical protein